MEVYTRTICKVHDFNGTDAQVVGLYEGYNESPSSDHAPDCAPSTHTHRIGQCHTHTPYINIFPNKNKVRMTYKSNFPTLRMQDKAKSQGPRPKGQQSDVAPCCTYVSGGLAYI
eukprot:131818-Pelagomonas_calceolata.AAC.4